MSWIDRELKRRTAKAAPTGPSPSPDVPAPVDAQAHMRARMQELWRRFDDANGVLPDEIRLRVDSSSTPASAGQPAYHGWLRAPNGAALGFTGEGIRYLWTEAGRGRSNNFWLHWNVPMQRYVLIQRVDSAVPPAMVEYRFDDRRIGYMVKCLVLGKRLKARSVRRRRLGLF